MKAIVNLRCSLRVKQRLFYLDVQEGPSGEKEGTDNDPIVVPIDLTAESLQDYVEDCPVCCPNVIHVEVDDDGNVRVWAEKE